MSLREMWDDGFRVSLVAFVLVAFLTLIAAAATLLVVLRETRTFAPIVVPPPGTLELIGTDVPDGRITISRQVCNTTNERLFGSITSSFIQIRSDSVQLVAPALSGVAVYESGCQDNQYEINIPDSLPDGEWRIVGRVLVSSANGNKFQFLPFESMSFQAEVVRRDSE